MLIADPPRLAGEALVDLASRYSTADIVDFSNEATGGNLTRTAINGRLNAALNKKAKAQGTTKVQLKEELTELRKAHGIRSTRHEPDHRHSVVGEDTTVGGDEASDGRQAPVPKSNQVCQKGQVKSAPQTDAVADTHHPKASDVAEENSDVDAEESAEDDESLAAQQQADHEAFKDQNSLKGEKMLILAERYSNADISARICGILGNYRLTESGVATRIHVALGKRAEATGATVKQVRDDLNDARIASGAVKDTPRGRGILRSPRGAKASKSARFGKDSLATKPSVVAQGGAKRKGAVKQSVGGEEEMEPPRKRAKKTHDTKPSVATSVAVEVDAEVTDDGSAAGSQDGHDADEVEAANALLEMAAGGFEVREAATILMNMHKEGAQQDDQPEQSDEKTTGDMHSSEMSDD